MVIMIPTGTDCGAMSLLLMDQMKVLWKQIYPINYLFNLTLRDKLVL